MVQSSPERAFALRVVALERGVSRKCFEHTANGILVDRTNPRHTVFVHPAFATSSTEEVIAKLDANEYGVLSKADLARVRATAKREKVLPPNLAQITVRGT